MLIQHGQLLFVTFVWNRFKPGIDPKGAAFSTEGWTNLVTKFGDEIGQNYDKDQLKSRWDVLKGDWRVWEQLRNLDTSLGWDAMKGTIHVTDDWRKWKLEVS